MRRILVHRLFAITIVLFTKLTRLHEIDEIFLSVNYLATCNFPTKSTILSLPTNQTLNTSMYVVEFVTNLKTMLVDSNGIFAS